jgi:hypothetical protein
MTRSLKGLSGKIALALEGGTKGWHHPFSFNRFISSSLASCSHKVKVQDKKSIPPDQQHLNFAREQLKDECVLTYYNHPAESTLNILHFRGKILSR